MSTTETTTTSSTHTAAAPEHLRVKPQTKATRGEKFTHFFSHWIINFFGNYALSVAITDLFMGYTPRPEKKGTTETIARDAKGKGDKAYTPHYEVTTYEDGTVKEKLTKIVFSKDNREVTRLPDDGLPPVRSYFAEKIPALRGLSDGCRKLYDGMHGGLEKGLSKVAGAQVSKTVADIISDVFTLMLGGHITTSIATYVNNRADKWARRFDNLFDSFGGGKPSDEEKAAREARYEELAAQPKLGASTIVKSRVLGFLMNTGMWSIVSTNVDWRRYKPGGADLMELEGKRLGIRGATQHFGDKISDWAITRNPGMSDHAKSRWKYWSELGLFEAACTANTSIAHVIMSAVGLKKKPEAPVTAASNSAPSARSDDAAPAQESAEPKEALADKKIARREEVKPREAVKPAEERRKESAGEALMATA